MTYELDGQDIVSYKYEYDANGNITQVKEKKNGTYKTVQAFRYDSLNQLEDANDYFQDVYFYYTYDGSGNIEQVCKRNLAPVGKYPIGSPEYNEYEYADSDWKDKLTSYDGDSITYDNIGNPMSYRDGMIMQWQNGRELASITKNTISYSFKYNLDGLRTQKIKKQGNTVLETVSYNYDSNNNLVGMKKGDTTVLYYYDSDGGLVSMSVEGSGNNPDTTYLFVKNLQGDITKILDDSGDVVATYAYDAWGTLLAENEDSSIEGLNPFRYRGYVYDPETELYYLQSRYYDPLTGRFLNADSFTDTFSKSPLSTNMFAYCENNPVMMSDSLGKGAWWIQSPNSAPTLWWKNGHTSVLIEQKKGFWWYVFWSGDSIQLFFLGDITGKEKKLNVWIRNTIKEYKIYYKNNNKDFNNLSYSNDRYTEAIIFKGDFTNVVGRIKKLMRTYKKEYGTEIYYLRFNCKFNPDKHEKIDLSHITHRKYKYNNKTYNRPRSWLILGNPMYDLLENNCMHMSIDTLRLGTFSYKDKEIKSFLWDLRGYYQPNRAFELLKAKNYGRYISW